MLFSVVIPTYNRAALLREALNSVFAQEFTDFEVIVVDDGSTDETKSVARSFGERVRFFRQENRGPGAARNLGIHRASGEYVAFLDSDDVWFPWTLATHVETIRASARPSFISGRGVAITEYGQVGRIKRPFRSKSYADMFSACAGATPPLGGTSSIAVSKQCVRNVGGFCEEFINGEDTDLWLRLGGAENFVRIYEPVLFAQRYHAERLTINLERSVRGSLFLTQREAEGVYPGGKQYAKQRRRIVAATARNVSLECLRVGERGMAWRLFRAALKWNLRLARVRYLAAFPVLSLLSSLRSALRPI